MLADPGSEEAKNSTQCANYQHVKNGLNFEFFTNIAAKQELLTSFIWNIFLYCFPKAFLGSVRTYRTSLPVRNTWTVLKKKGSKSFKQPYRSKNK